MTQTLPVPPTRRSDTTHGPSHSIRRLKDALRLTAGLATLPYIALKIDWIAGGRTGIPDGSGLLDHGTALVVGNSLSVLMDALVMVMALTLTRPWGMRAPAWLLAFPVWVATGLLAPIMTAYPAQLLVRALGGAAGGAHGAKSEPFLDEWVFAVVYGGFIVQGLALGTLFVLYARERWSPLWHGRIGALPVSDGGAAQRFTAVAAAVLALFPLTLHLLWACGSTAGLTAERGRETGSDLRVLEACYVVFLLAMVVSVAMLAFRWGRALPVRGPLAVAWVSVAAVTCWGGWMCLAGLAAGDAAHGPGQVMSLAYAVQVISGVMAAGIGAQFLAERASRLRARAAG